MMQPTGQDSLILNAHHKLANFRQPHKVLLLLVDATTQAALDKSWRHHVMLSRVIPEVASTSTQPCQTMPLPGVMVSASKEAA